MTICGCVDECLWFFCIPGQKTLGLKRISKMMSLIEPTSLQAARTALVARESAERIKKHFKDRRGKVLW